MTVLTPWQTIARRRVFTGGPIREIAVEAVRLPDGRTVPDYYQIELPDYVLVYAEMADGRVPLLRQYKHGARRECLTFPGGAIEDGESPLAAAQRELLEELGCTAAEWRSLGSFVTNANQRCNTAHLFRALGCVETATPRSGDLEDTVITYFTPDDLTAPARLPEIGLATHALLLVLASAGR